MTVDKATSEIPSVHRDTKEVISRAEKVLIEYHKKKGNKKSKVIKVAKSTWIVRNKDDIKRPPSKELMNHLERIGL